MKKQLQFQLWQECNSNCEFCYLGKQKKYTDDNIKINSLKLALQKISDLSIYKEYDTISYLGGQFFQGQMKNLQVKQNFFKLIEKTAQLYNNNIIKNVWLYATLTIGQQQDLYKTLTYFKDKKNFWLLTSYDTKGRFHSKKMLQNWDYHMKNIYKLYPDIKFNITTILSKDCIQKYLNDQISFKKMMNNYHCAFFFKQCGCRQFTGNLDYFFPPRQLFLKFLTKFRKTQSNIMWDKLFNLKYRADQLYRNYNNQKQLMVKYSRNKSTLQQNITIDGDKQETNICGHTLSYAAYSDSNKCVICDKKLIEQMIQ